MSMWKRGLGNAAGPVVMAALLLLAAGCREEEAATDLDRFVDRTGDLTEAALADTLWSAIQEGPPNSVYASFLLGNHYYQAAGDSAATLGWSAPGVGALLDSSEVHFTRAATQDTTFIEAFVNMGSVWDDRSERTSDRSARQDAMRQAESWYRKALELDPTDEKARCNLGGLYLRQRLNDRALQEFQTALEHNPESALAHYNIAIMFAEAKIYREAIREWELASKYDPEGDIGERSRDNIRIVTELMNAPPPGPPGQ